MLTDLAVLYVRIAEMLECGRCGCQSGVTRRWHRGWRGAGPRGGPGADIAANGGPAAISKATPLRMNSIRIDSAFLPWLHWELGNVNT